MGITAVILKWNKNQAQSTTDCSCSVLFLSYTILVFVKKKDVESVGIMNVWSQIRQIVYV